MTRRIIAMLLALAALCGAACAEAYSGVTAALSEITVCAEADGVLESVLAEAGASVDAGDVLAKYRTNRVFAAQDGTVARIHCAEGAQCSGTALEIMPMEKYRIYCTSDGAYASADAKLMHAGEQVYIKCTVNGSHRGIGVVTGIEGSEYSVLTVGGEFHVGEAVNLYRDAEFSAEQRVGIGTVVENETEKYESGGTIVRLYVEEGEAVERGQLLYETVSGSAAEIRTDAAGIVSEVSAANGDAVQRGQALAVIVPEGNICAEVSTDENALRDFRIGMRVQMVYTADREETPLDGTVVRIDDADDQGLYRIIIAPDEGEGLRLGMTVRVITD